MKVLMFGWEFPPYISGGLGTACHGLTQGLSEKQVPVTFVVPKLSDGAQSHVRLLGANQVTVTRIGERLVAMGEHIKYLTVDSPLMPYLSPTEYMHHADIIRTGREQETVSFTFNADFSGNYGPDLMSEIARYSLIAGLIAEAEACDVIHVHDWMTFPAGIEAKRTSGRPLVVHVHALEFDRSGENINHDVYNIEKAGMEAADIVIAVSHYTKNIIIDRYGIPEAKVRVVHNAVARAKRVAQLKIHKALDEKIVLFLGRITFQKGPDYFVEAARLVIDRIPDVRFVMAGSGDMFPRMVERVAQLRLGRYFHFTGFLKGLDVEKMYAMSDLYVMPSVSEPFGIAPLEAMLFDVPIIVSKQSGVAEILNHAVKVDFWDIPVLADKIIALLTQPAVAAQMVEHNREQLTHIKWDIAAEKVISIYNELIGGQR